MDNLAKKNKAATTSVTNFIKNIINEDLENNKNNGNVITRFPPEPNGYLHIGHAKSICLNFSLAKDYNGRCHLRFDDTNPEKEKVDYINSIKKDIKWLGFDWGEHLYYASNYFDKLYEYAVKLIKKNKAFVCNLSPEQIREYRGTLTSPGKNSPYRDRSIEENLELFEKMKNNEFEEGTAVLRAKIDMSSPNLNMRDPILYRIKKLEHHRTGNKWVIYPTYDFTHCLSDAIESITHSICTLEFADHRPLYDWVINEVDTEAKPQQIEFARLNLNYTVMSKRKLLTLVEKNIVSGWDDPRMPTISGLRKRGYTAESIKDFCDRIGVAKANSVVDIALLEHCLKEDLNKKAQRVMVVLNPIKVVITNFIDDEVIYLDAENNPEDETMGKRKIPFTKTLYIEKEDFMENPPNKKFFRLSPGKEVRLKHAYYIKCEKVIKNENTGEILEIHCTYDPATKGGWSDDGRKVKGTLHWVSEKYALNVKVNLYDRLLTKDILKPEDDFLEFINPDSLEVLENCYAEPFLENAEVLDNFQFLRKGYFCLDSESTKNNLIFNRTTPLRDSWAKIIKNQKK